MNKNEACALYENYSFDAPDFGLDHWSGWARVVNVIDGDTVVVLLKCGLGVIKAHIRLNGIDAPELHSKDPVEKEKGLIAKCEAIKYITNISIDHHTPLSRSAIIDMFHKNMYLVWLSCNGSEKFGRTLGNIYREDGNVSLSDHLLAMGLARPYFGGHKMQS